MKIKIKRIILVSFIVALFGSLLQIFRLVVGSLATMFGKGGFDIFAFIAPGFLLTAALYTIISYVIIKIIDKSKPKVKDAGTIFLCLVLSGIFIWMFMHVGWFIEKNYYKTDYQFMNGGILPDDCESLKKEGNTEACYERKAVATLNPAYCRKTYFVSACLAKLAKLKNDFSVCEFARNDSEIDSCQRQILRDIIGCQSGPKPGMDCGHDILSAADKTICLKMRSAETKQQCEDFFISQTVKAFSDESDCMGFDSQESRVKCFVELAKSKKDKLICDNLDGIYQVLCYGEVAHLRGDTSICQELPSSAVYNGEKYHSKSHCQALSTGSISWKDFPFE